LRRRRLHQDIPDTLLVPGAEPLPLSTETTASAERPAEDSTHGKGRSDNPVVGRQKQESIEVSRRRKRTIALCIVILVALSIPALVLALIFAG
jgi:hypothetical protein